MVTRGVLRGPRYRRVFPDVYVAAHLTLTLAQLSRAAYLLVEGSGVVAGYAAAELLGASSAPPGAPVEVLMLGGRHRRSHPRLVIRRDVLGPGETISRCGVQLTGPVRTALDLARWAPTLTEKVAAVDALAFRCGVTVEAVRALARIHLGAHRSRGLGQVLELVNGLAESPMESRIRMAIVLGGLPAPVVQHPVSLDGRRYRLDLAYPELRLAIEYDGELHRTQLRAHADLLREADLTRLGWTILRFDAHTTLHRPDHVADTVRAVIAGTATSRPSVQR
ncbi:endonuclease domain-containing protein [Pseudonocardia saturnea]